MKKALSLILALVLCLSFAPLTAMTVNAAVLLKIDKTNYNPGDIIIATVSGVTAQMQEEEAWVGIFKTGASATDWTEEWCQFQYLTEGTNQFEFDAPAAGGSYEVRLYRDNYAPYTVLIAAPFTVGGTSGSDNNTGSTEQNDDTVIRYPTKDEFDWSLVDFATGIHSFTGTYETDYDTLSMIQNGGKVTGQYPGWCDGTIEGNVIDGVLYGYWFQSSSGSPTGFHRGQLVFVMNADGKGFTGWWRYGNSGDWGLWSSGARNVQETSGWASEEVSKADALGLIPDCLKGTDFAKPITRAEFAAVSVKVYEALSGEKAVPAAANPFTDTKDPEVLKAYNVGITKGMSATTFEPDRLLDRETAATMLTRVFKKIAHKDWTLDSDSQFTLPYEKPAPFADDAKISDWAKDSVYFMAANEIIKGMGNNMFAPKNTTDAEIAMSYANATREQALIIAARMVEKLG